jgi:hypothetical protein
MACAEGTGRSTYSRARREKQFNSESEGVEMPPATSLPRALFGEDLNLRMGEVGPSCPANPKPGGPCGPGKDVIGLEA